jgi:non-ribosomal peptide synthetase component F
MEEAEKRQMLEEWCRERMERERGGRVEELFEEEAERSAEAVAVVCEGEQISYGELNRRANQLGNHLRRCGVGAEAVVGVCLERTIEMAVAVMGVWKAGGVYLPLDPGYPEPRLRWMMEDAGAEVVVTGGGAGARVRDAGVRVVDVEEEWKEIEKSGSTRRDRAESRKE